MPFMKLNVFLFPLAMQVCSGHCIQVSAKTRVGRQELCLLGPVSLQQLVGGASQQQGDAHRAYAPPAAPRNIVGLWHRISVFLRRCRLSALVHVWHRLRSASLSRVQRVEQVFNSPHRAAHPGSLRGIGLHQLTKPVLLDFLCAPDCLHLTDCDGRTLLTKEKQ